MRILTTIFCSAGALMAQAVAPPFDPKMPANVPEVTGDVREIAPLRYIDLKIGTGAPALPGKQYTVNYNGWLRSGKVFDSTYDRHEPFVFVQGRRQVIAGWEIAFEGMRVGGKRRIFIPPQLAYGERGSGTAIPPNAEMIQDVELMEVSDVPPAPSAAADLLFPLDDMASKTVALAQAVPQEKYSWRPAAGVRSMGEVFLHIVYANEMLSKLASEAVTREALDAQIAQNAKNEKQSIDKSQIVALLKESFAKVRNSLEEVRAGALSRDAEFFGQKTTRRGVWTMLDTHVAEHLGQAIAYARMNGITPPWSERR